MIISAKFASTCPVCGAGIAVGSKVEWAKGERARHVQCTTGTAVSTARSSRRHWKPCGYPGCNPNFCDECDGAGYQS